MRRYLLFGVLALPVLLGAVSTTAVAVAFPMMVSEFDTSLILAGWVLGIYQLVTIGSIPITSRLSDSLGRKPVFILCLVLFTSGSFLCAISPNIGWLIFSRAIQAIGGGGFISVVTGIIVDELPGMRQQLIGLLSSVANFGAIVGPNLGGIMTESWGWHSIFWMNIPFGLIAIVLSRYFIKTDKPRTSQPGPDYLGIGLLTGFVSVVMITLTLKGKAYNISPIVTSAMVLLGILLLIGFIYHCRKSTGAVISLQLLTRRPFLAANFYSFVYGACAQSGILSFLPLYGATIYAMSAVESGLMITPRSFGMLAASIVASLALLKWGYRRPIIAGTLVMSLSMAVLAFPPEQISLGGMTLTPLIFMMLLALALGIGAGVVTPASNNACIELMPDKVSSITGLRQVFRQMGGAIGIAVTTLVLESSANVAQGFTILFISFSSLQLLSILAVFFMPERPRG